MPAHPTKTLLPGTALLALALLTTLTGCASTHGTIGVGIGMPGIHIGIGTTVDMQDQQAPPQPQAPPDIPPDYLPPPGKCRIWYRDRAPEDQPPPGDCEELKRNVPKDANLIRSE